MAPATKKISVHVGYDEDDRSIREIRETPVVTFHPVSDDITQSLIGFLADGGRRNLGKSIEIDGRVYTLDYLSIGSNWVWRSRSFSAYFTVGRSVIRISDHWSESGFNRSRKMNCDQIGDAYWVLSQKIDTRHMVTYRCGKYPWVVAAGIAGKSVLNKSVDHWSERTPGTS
ncbi:MAG: hypothetical protein ACTHV8_10920 [Nesterenkonia sp.]